MNTGIIFACALALLTRTFSPFQKSAPNNVFSPVDTLVKPEIDGLNFEPIPNAIFSHNSPTGRVFLLPLDKMPCLVPDSQFVNSMPIYRPPMGLFLMPNKSFPDTTGMGKKLP
jgi:hypothetical protein